jgi:replicative DNA helicase
MLRSWNLRNSPPLEGEAVPAVVSSAFEGKYDYGCNDSVLSAYCYDDCVYRRRRKEREIKWLDDYMDGYTERAKAGRGIYLGMNNIDHELGGLHSGQVMGFYAKTGTGKTAWAMNAMKRVGGGEGKAVLFFSIEMPGEDVYERAAQITFSKTWREIERSARYDKLNRARIREAFGPLRLVDAPRITHEELTAYVEKANETLAVDLVVIDYLGRMDGPGKSTYERVSKLAERMKDQAKELKLPILFLGQLNNQAINTFTRVELPMLRDSGVQAESSDYICGAWRDGIETSFCVELLKGRRAKTGIISRYEFSGATMELRCMDPTPREEEEP